MLVAALGYFETASFGERAIVLEATVTGYTVFLIDWGWKHTQPSFQFGYCYASLVTTMGQKDAHAKHARLIGASVKTLCDPVKSAKMARMPVKHRPNIPRGGGGRCRRDGRLPHRQDESRRGTNRPAELLLGVVPLSVDSSENEYERYDGQ
jgi:hypothetical protein